MLKWCIYVVILISLSSFVQANVIINEIFYDAIGGDDDKEWIEIFNNGAEGVDLTGWRFNESGTNHLLSLKQGNWTLDGFSYAVIAEDWENFSLDYPDYNGTLFDSAFSLSNTGETLRLRNSTKGGIVDSVSYLDPSGDETGFSLGRLKDGNWYEMIPSPGYSNEGKSQNICDYQVVVESDKLIFENKTDVNWKFVITKNLGYESRVLINRSVENEFGISQVKYSTLNKSIKTKETIKLSPNLNPGIYVLKSNITTEDCMDINKANNYDVKLIVVKGSYPDDDSYLSIERVLDLGTDKKAKWGQVIRVRVNGYKGDTTKSSLKVYAVKDKTRISKESKTSLFDKYSNNTLTLPIQLIDNCNKRYEDGIYEIVFEGLGEKTSKEFEIKGLTKSICGKSTTNIKSSGKVTFEIVGVPENIESSEVNTTLKVINEGEMEVRFKVWSYVYKGSTSISGERESNIKNVIVKGNSTKEVRLQNQLVGKYDPGDYKLKVKILKEGRKTTDDLTEELYVSLGSSSSEIAFNEPNLVILEEDISISPIGEVIYQSSDVKALNFGLYFFIGVLVLLYGYLIFKKDL